MADILEQNLPAAWEEFKDMILSIWNVNKIYIILFLLFVLFCVLCNYYIARHKRHNH